MHPVYPLLLFAAAISAPALATEVVPVQSFRSIQLRGGGNVTVVPGSSQRVTIVEGSSASTQFSVDGNGRLRIDACNRGCPQRYRLRIRIESPRVPDLAISGGGEIGVANGFGSQPRLAAAVHGGGRIDASSLAVGNAAAAVSGGGQILVRATGTLSAAVKGGGSIRYSGRPRVATAITGGGSVRAVN